MAHANLPLRSYHGTRNGCSRREGGKGSWHRELSLSRFVVWTRGEPSGRAARATCCTVGCARASSQRFTPSLRLGLPIFASRARSPAWTMSDAVKSGPGCSSVIHCANSASAPVCNVTAGGLVVGATVEAVEAVEACGMAGRSIANASFVSKRSFGALVAMLFTRCLTSEQRRRTCLSDEMTSTDAVSGRRSHHSASRTIPSSARHFGPKKFAMVRSPIGRARWRWSHELPAAMLLLHGFLWVFSSTSTMTVGSPAADDLAHVSTRSRKSLALGHPVDALTLS